MKDLDSDGRVSTQSLEIIYWWIKTTLQSCCVFKVCVL